MKKLDKIIIMKIWFINKDKFIIIFKNKGRIFIIIN